MINVKFGPNNISVVGHADYSKYGKDIICASVSTLIIFTVNLLLEFDVDEKLFSYNIDEGNFFIEYDKKNEQINKIINVFKLSIKDLSTQYPKNIKIL